MGWYSKTLKQDLRRYNNGRSVDLRLALWLVVARPGGLAVALLRLQQQMSATQHHRLAATLRSVALVLTGADLLPGSQVGPGLLLEHPTGVVIGHGAVIGRGCTILQGVTVGERYTDGSSAHDYPRIGDEVTIGAGACVLGGVVVGARARIGANAVVLCDIPAGATAVGVPATYRLSAQTG